MRERIIVAASKILTEKGYAAIRLREIIHEAQAGPGLGHYMLTTLRNGLCVKLLA